MQQFNVKLSTSKLQFNSFSNLNFLYIAVDQAHYTRLTQIEVLIYDKKYSYPLSKKNPWSWQCKVSQLKRSMTTTTTKWLTQFFLHKYLTSLLPMQLHTRYCSEWRTAGWRYNRMAGFHPWGLMVVDVCRATVLGSDAESGWCELDDQLAADLHVIPIILS